MAALVPIVRDASEKDLAEVAALLVGLEQEPRPSRDLHTWREMLAQPGRSILVAESEGRLVGTLDLLVIPNLTRGGRPYAMAENIVVTEGHRREGVGSALLDAAVDRARGADCYKVQLLSNKDRTEAHGFYRACGFEALAEGFRRYL